MSVSLELLREPLMGFQWADHNVAPPPDRLQISTGVLLIAGRAISGLQLPPGAGGPPPGFRFLLRRHALVFVPEF